jgi:hypothetical protein
MKRNFTCNATAFARQFARRKPHVMCRPAVEGPTVGLAGQKK